MPGIQSRAAHDCMMEQRDSDPGAMLADKGYDSDAIRQDLRDRGATPEIPSKRHSKLQYSVSKPLYALRPRSSASPVLCAMNWGAQRWGAQRCVAPHPAARAVRPMRALHN
jgi:hypothetical protein